MSMADHEVDDCTCIERHCEHCTCRRCRPARPVDVVELRKRMAAVSTIARSVSGELDDIASLAYDVAVGEHVGVTTSTGGHAHTSTGDRRAKVALDALEHSVSQYARALRDVTKITASGVVDTTLRGTTLGDGSGKHPADTLRELRANQAERRERGEYTPARIVDQPTLPDNRKGQPGRTKSKKKRRK